MISKKTFFQNNKGERLAARIDLPKDSTYSAFALFAHCFTCTKDIKAAVNLARALCTQGIAVMRFDFPGLGESEGDFTETNFSSNVQDLIAAAAFLEQEYVGPKLLIGHSLGGAAVIKAAASIASSKAVVTINTPAAPKRVVEHFQDERDAIVKNGSAQVTLMAHEVTMTKQFVADVESTGIANEIAQLGRALLVMHAPQDKIVNIDNAGLIFQQARHPKSFVSLDDADHLLSKREDAAYAAAVIAVWASRYLK